AVIDDLLVRPIELSDAKIGDEVLYSLATDPATDSWDITVSVEEGIVTLNGTVESWAEKNVAEYVAKGVMGVRGIKNKIEVDYETDRPDSEIRQDILRRMQASIWLDAGSLDISVKNGKVTLEGVVGSALEKRVATEKALVSGVTAVDENLEVKWWARDQLRREDKYVHKSDQEIKEAVEDAFLYDPRVYTFKIDVDVEDAVVTLTGVVDNLQAKRKAAEDARNTIGVYRVKNHIKVRPTEILKDSAVTNNVEHALVIDPIVERYELDVMTINGRVYLNGRVDTEFEKEHAEDVTSKQPGVISIGNNIIVEETWEPKSDWAVKEDIKDEFFWSLFVDGDNINIDVEDGLVTLTGTVSSHYEAQLAVHNAFEGGARMVSNELDVESGYQEFPEEYYKYPYSFPYFY
ncbi:BON domain-containing protein, partial [candidate division KSB1 bacterium]|nr:BON domain-containing protein [candidate division KSB1 bacterium]